MSGIKCKIVSMAKVTPVTFDIKFVNVENERVFAEFSGPEVFCNSVDCIYKNPLQLRMRNKRNLMPCPMKSPDFWEMNSHQNHIVAEYKRKRMKHRKMRDLRSESDAGIELKKKIFPSPLPNFVMRQENMSALVDALLLDIYGPLGDKSRSESDSTFSSTPYPRNSHVQRLRLHMKSVKELRVARGNLWIRINHVGSMLIRQLRRRDNLIAKRDKYYDVITAHLQALSNRRSEDTRMRFSLIPQPGESGFPQWLDAMKMVTKLQGGIPPEFRKRLWLTLAERHLAERGVDWNQAEKICFNEWSNPDDDELGIQIVKDLHRTGCSLFCGAAGRDNQAVLRRVLLGFARWNKSVGYCQGLNVLAALILQVVDRAESAAVKVMIYLVEGVLPEAYFADNLRGLSIDMAVFRDLLRVRLPKLSRHLEALQMDSRDKNVVGSNYEPPLTNVFTMQWFLTLFCHCLPQEAVLRVWDLIFLEGDEVLLRTALAIWEGLADRIMPVKSADEFYSIMGVLTREMLEFTDTNYLIKRIVNMGPLYGVTSLREKHRYNITPWARRLSDDDETDTEEDRFAVETATVMMNISRKKDRSSSPMGALLPSSDRERLALDISSLKQQYAKLRERQRQAHIILSAACARQTMVPSPSSPAINHLLVGKTALVSGKTRQIGPPVRVAKKSSPSATKAQSREDKQGVTLHWKDMKKSKDITSAADVKRLASSDGAASESAKTDSDSDSTSTELCDEPDRLSDLDSGEPSSASECGVDRWSPRASPIDYPEDPTNLLAKSSEIHDLTERIDKLSWESIPGSEVTDPGTKLSEESSPKRSVQLESEFGLDVKVGAISVDEKVSDTGLPDEVSCEVELEGPIRSAETARYLGSDDETRSDAGSNQSRGFKDALETNQIHFDSESELVVTCKIDTYQRDDKDCTAIDKEIGDRDKTGRESSPLGFERETGSDFRFDFKESKMLEERGEVEFRDTKLQETKELGSNRSQNLGKSEQLYGADEGYLRSDFTSDDYQIDKPLEATNEVVQKYQYKFDLSDKFDSKYSYDEFEYKPSYKEDRTCNLISDTFYKRYDDKEAKFQESPKFHESPKFSSPKSPESTKSYSSGETLGPDSKISTVTDLTPIDQEGPFCRKKSVGSSGSSESKTLTFKSGESEDSKLFKKQEVKTNSIEIASPWTTMSTDSLQNKSDPSPKLVVSASSSESYSPGKHKFSERSFSSDLQSPVSANSINYQVNYKNKEGNPSESPSIETIAITSPFYPIAHPNQKTPSPYSSKPKSETPPKSRLETFDNDLRTTALQYTSEPYDYKPYKYNPTTDIKKSDDFLCYSDGKSLTKTTSLKTEALSDSYTEDGMDTLSPLPKDGKFEFLHRGRDDRKLLGITGTRAFGRSSSSLDKTLGDLKASSNDEFETKSVKKRSSDILEDIRHLEAKSETGSKDTSNLTKITGYIWEDVKDLEARRQDTFSDSAKSFSRETLSRPAISVSTEMRKTYVVEPKINIEDGSILKSMTKTKTGDEDDDRESKLGVWTKVKPRKKGENGRRSSDRALKIIQENSAILQKILTCQAKKRLPDLEAISKEITISPINEEISKIFSPILEKMGLNEHEINEELARINFQELDHKFDVQSTCTSGFSAKINDELSKLSIIDDNEEMNHLALDEFIAEDYLNTREAVIDRQINEELSKLLGSCDAGDRNKEKMQYFSYKSVDSDTSTLSEGLDYQDPIPRYRGLSPKSDVDIYHELERLDLSTNIPSTSTIDVAYNPTVPYTTSRYSPILDKPSSPYSSYKLYNYSTKLSPNVSESSTIIPTQKSPLDSGYDFATKSTDPIDYTSSYLSKETLEFRVRYDQENSSDMVFPESKYYKDDYSYDSFNTYHASKFDLTSPIRYSYSHSTNYDEGSDLVSSLPGTFDPYSRISKHSPGYRDSAKRPVSHPEFAGNTSLTKYPEEPVRDSSAYRTSSLSLDNIGQKPAINVDTTPSPKTHFSPFPVRNSTRKPKDLALKLGLYSPTRPTSLEPLKRS